MPYHNLDNDVMSTVDAIKGHFVWLAKSGQLEASIFQSPKASTHVITNENKSDLGYRWPISVSSHKRTRSGLEEEESYI
jgi:hypothetical protein